MKSMQTLKGMALVTVSAAAVSVLIQACGGSAVAETTSGADPIEGAWASDVTIKDCTSGAVLGQFKGTTLFIRGGTLAADNTMPVPTRGAAFGVWQVAASGSYGANMWFYRFNADGTPAGTQKVKRVFTLSADSNAVTGTLTLQVIDNSGAVVHEGCGTEAGTRVTF